MTQYILIILHKDHSVSHKIFLYNVYAQNSLIIGMLIEIRKEVSMKSNYKYKLFLQEVK